MLGGLLSRRAAVFACALAGVWALPLAPESLQLLGRLTLGATIAALAMRFLAPLLPRPTLPHLHKRAVLITGCSSGFGLRAALALDRVGVLVIATCRTPSAPAVLDLQKKASSRLRVVKMDVASEESVQAAAKEVKDILGDNKLWAVVNNAGFMPMGEVLLMDYEDMKRAFEVNMWGHVHVFRAFAPLLIESRGRIVSVLTLACRVTLAGLTPYTMSKSASLALANGLREEMRKFGVSVHVIDPYAYRTPLVENRFDTLNASWKKCPESIKALYGENYLEDYKKRTGLASYFFYPESKSTIIADAIVDACVAKDPQIRYVPSVMGSLLDISFGNCRWMIGLLHLFLNPGIRKKA